MIRLVLFVCLCVAALGCGVKGDPLPPEGAPNIGRGHPTYRKAVERFDVRTEPLEDEELKEKKETTGE
jgi:hypothetical protein